MAQPEGKEKWSRNIPFPDFCTKKPGTILRLSHLISFSFTSSWALLRQVGRRLDMIFVVEAILFCTPGVLFTGALTNAKTVLNIQGFEIDAMFGLELMNKGFLATSTFALERYTISSSMFNLVKQKV